jgi:hypothetical protein
MEESLSPFTISTTIKATNNNTTSKMEQLGINLMRYMQCIYKLNFQIFLRGTKDDLNIWKVISHF